MYDLPSWVLESEEDFPLGAKATPFLPPATSLDNLSHDVGFDLPDWMESKEVLGLDSVELFNETEFLQALKYDNSEVQGHIGLEETTTTIKPEDMLVPLSELQPQTSTPVGVSANPIPDVKAPIATNINGCMDLPQYQLHPQISIPVGVPASPLPRVQGPVTTNINGCVDLPLYQLQPHTSIPQISAASVPKIIVCKVTTRIPQQQIVERKIHTVPDIQLVPPATKCSTSDADTLINEMVQMIGTSNGSFNGSIAGIDDSVINSSMVEANMDDLLIQLEAENSQLKDPNASSLNLEPTSPLPLPSPVPSTGCLSPQSTQDSLFATLLSPSENSLGTEGSGIEDLDDSLDQLAHTYSMSPLKKKGSRKSSSRKTPYSGDRKERKKEQNKQAALRYRQKKKQEDTEIMAVIHAEEDRQKELSMKHTKLKQELSCLKKIMRDLFIAKGILSEDSFKKK